MSEPRKRLSGGAPAVVGRPEVDLFDTAYTVRPITRSVEIKLRELESQVDAATDSDAEFALVADQFDLLLAPANGKRTKASKLLTDNWKADKLAPGDVVVFFEEVLKLAAERPT